MSSAFTLKSAPKLCEKFIGQPSTINIQTWLDVFAAVIIDWPDSERIRALPRHLADQALEWFAWEIVPDLPALSWGECRRRMLKRLGHTIGNPIVDAFERRLNCR